MQTATEIDRLWFLAHSDRAYRLRRQTPGELERCPVPPRPGFTGWCIILREDGAMELFALADGETWDDYDEKLAPFFDNLRSAA